MAYWYLVFIIWFYCRGYRFSFPGYGGKFCWPEFLRLVVRAFPSLVWFISEDGFSIPLVALLRFIVLLVVALFRALYKPRPSFY